MATISDVKICNIALRELHANTIASLTEESLEAETCNLYYNLARNFVLSSAPWNFAIVRSDTLAELSTAPKWGYDNAFAYPTDCLRILELNDVDAVWRVELNDSGTRIIVTDESDIKLRYIKEITDPQQFSPSFVFALAKYLKHVLAVPMTGQSEKAQIALQEYQAFLGTAKTDSGQESSPVLFHSTALADPR
jgi:hypothetical protein